MSEVRPPDARDDAKTLLGDPSAPSDEDFLYHLYRGSELLVQDRVPEAKEELLRALSLQPQDAKGQDLLAGVYFRLGVYPRAIEIWGRLVEAFPRDATLHVNLALALLKTGQREQARVHLHTALELNPDHARAWGYLGLVHWRRAEHEAAREAFLRGGQASMVRRMETVIATSPGSVPAPAPEPRDDGRRAAMRSAAEEAIEQFEAEQVPLTLASTSARPAAGRWTVAEPGSEALATPPRPAPALPVPGAPTLDGLLSAWASSRIGAAPLAVAPNGMLLVRTGTSVCARLSGLRSVSGELRTTPVQRRARGRELPELLGGADPIFRYRGPVSAILAPPAAGSLQALRLDGDVLFVREELLFAFDDGIEYESGTVMSGTLRVVQLHGEGTAVLALARTPTAVQVEEGREARVDPAALVGWTGRLLPSERPGGTQPYAAHAPPLTFRGDGMVLIA